MPYWMVTLYLVRREHGTQKLGLQTNRHVSNSRAFATRFRMSVVPPSDAAAGMDLHSGTIFTGSYLLNELKNLLLVNCGAWL